MAATHKLLKEVFYYLRDIHGERVFGPVQYRQMVAQVEELEKTYLSLRLTKDEIDQLALEGNTFLKEDKC